MYQTERLAIKALNGHDLKAYAINPIAFAKEHHLVTTQAQLNLDLLEAIETSFLPNVNNPSKEYIFYTLWLMIEKDSQSVVGAICFHGEPENGIAEIGYGSHDESRNQGFMLEAIAGLLNWSSLRNDIETLVAETDNDNFASIHVLQKSGFTKYETKENSSIFFCKLQSK